jgi:hypothetical protein
MKAMSGLVEITIYSIDPIFLWYSVFSDSIILSSIGKEGSSSSAIEVGGYLSDWTLIVNLLTSFSIYTCWESQRDRFSLSLKMCIPGTTSVLLFCLA